MSPEEGAGPQGLVHNQEEDIRRLPWQPLSEQHLNLCVCLLRHRQEAITRDPVVQHMSGSPDDTTHSPTEADGQIVVSNFSTYKNVKLVK